jgi:hypothetical protein
MSTFVAEPASGRETEAESDAAALVAATDEYSGRWYRPLTGEEISAAHDAVGAMRDAALELQTAWELMLPSVPTTADVQAAMEPSAVRSRLLRPFLTDSTAGRLIDLVGKFNRFTTRGHGLLRAVDPAVAYARHCEREVAQLDQSDRETAELHRRTTFVREDIEMVQSRIQHDVDSQRSQIEILSMYSQMALAKRVTDLTRIVAALTLFLFVATVGVLISAVFSAFFH